MQKKYVLPKLDFDYGELEPYISREQLQIHHQKHHQGYVNGANSLLEKLEKLRKKDEEVDMKSILKNLSFNIGGHVLHSLFWKNLTPAHSKTSKPTGHILNVIKNEFGGFDRFKKEFFQAALSVEGSGWAALAWCSQMKEPLIMQIEKHNTNIYPAFNILLVLDIWEHAYYLDYKNERGKFIESFWNIVNWDEVNRRINRR